MTRLGAFLPLAFALSCGADVLAGRKGDHEHGHAADLQPEPARRLNLALDPKAGAEPGLAYEAWLSPQQEAEEESDVPASAPAVFKSTAPSVPREARPGRGHGAVVFTKDFSRAYVELALSDVPAAEIVMVHLHCGKPGQLGPIIVDFGAGVDLQAAFADGVLSYEVTNADLERVIDGGEGLVGAFTAGCPIFVARPDDRVRTLAGMAVVADEGELYFNVHTRGQTFYGDVRGQLRPMERTRAAALALTEAPRP